ncbi:MAG: sensor histidine kinase [Saprospiraceae bacterium]
MLTTFKIRIALHLLAILAVTFAGVYLWNTQAGTALLLLLGGVLLGLIASLYRQITITDKKLSDFLLNIKYNDFEAYYSAVAGEKTQRDLSSAFNLITGKFRSIRQEKEAQHLYLQAIVEQVDTGLICFDERGKTVLMNRGAQQLLHKSHFPNIEFVKKYNHALHAAFREMATGERTLVKLIVNNQVLQVSVRKTVLKIGGDVMHLYVLQNIHTELEHQEVESWQKLIRILTHEILNSVAPVVSLSEMTNTLLQEPATNEPERQESIRQAVQAIQRRSAGLLHFTETYRELTKIPQPRFEPADPAALVERVLPLFAQPIQEHGVRVEKHYPATTLSVPLDTALLEQVLINLIKNALEALAETAQPRLILSVTKTPEGAVEIAVADNGQGIPDELLGQIFVPFFTTKKTGSGIGLSLSRQIVHLHRGSLYATSQVGVGSVFTIRV